jgi:hypothetical protein
MRDVGGDSKTASFFKDFEWKSLWENGEVDEENYNEWIKKYDLAFLFEESADEGEDDGSDSQEEERDQVMEDLVTKILSEGLGQSPVEDLVSEIKASVV